MGAERPQASGSQAHGPVDESNHPFLGDARTTGGFRERSAMGHLSKASGCDMMKRRCDTLVCPQHPLHTKLSAFISHLQYPHAIRLR